MALTTQTADTINNQYSCTCRNVHRRNERKPIEACFPTSFAIKLCNTMSAPWKHFWAQYHLHCFNHFACALTWHVSTVITMCNQCKSMTSNHTCLLRLQVVPLLFWNDFRLVVSKSILSFHIVSYCWRKSFIWESVSLYKPGGQIIDFDLTFEDDLLLNKTGFLQLKKMTTQNQVAVWCFYVFSFEPLQLSLSIHTSHKSLSLHLQLVQRAAGKYLNWGQAMRLKIPNISIPPSLLNFNDHV